MDRIDILVAVAHRRLRLRRLLIAIERNPKILEDNDMAISIKKPIQLAGLSTHLMRVEAVEKVIAGVHARYEAVVPAIEELAQAHILHVGDLETYEKKLRDKIEGLIGSNGGDPLSDGQDGQQSGDQHGQVISSETEA